MVEAMVPLLVAAERSGQSVVRLGRWCATGKLRCDRDAMGWVIPASEEPSIATVATEHAAAVRDSRVTALAVPAPTAPLDLADLVAAGLGPGFGTVTVTPLALDGVDYVVAVWAGTAEGSGGLPALADLAVALEGELLDGEVATD